MNSSVKGHDSRASPSLVTPLLALSTRYHIPLLIGIAMVARMAIFQLDHVIFSWRSTDMAGIALNYYRNGYHFLYPQVYWGGSGPGYVEMEFPIIPFLLALLYKLFGVQDWLGLIIPMLSGVGLVVVVYLMCRHLFDPVTGFFAGLFTATSPPLAAQTMALWPDPPMIFFGALGLYALTRWTQRNTWGYFFLGAFSTSLAILLKLTALYAGIPILFLCFVRYGFDLLKKPLVWFLACLILIPPILWYGHAHTLYLEYHNTFGILTGGFMKFATAELLLNPMFYVLSLGRMIFYHFTPLVFVVFMFGVLASQPDKLRYIFHVWFGAVLLYLLVAAEGVSIGHYQYMLPIVPPGAALAAYGILSLLRKLKSVPRFATWPRSAWTVILALLFVAGTFAATYEYHSPKYTTKMWDHDERTGRAVGRATLPGSLIIVVDNQMGGPPEKIMTPPNVFYFSDRHGWYVALSWLNEELIEQRRSEGGRYLVVTGNTVPLFDASYAHVKDYLSTHYAKILDGEDGVMYDLGSSKN